jgi:hypothetical protein
MPPKYGSGHSGAPPIRENQHAGTTAEGALMLPGPRLTDPQLRQGIMVLGITQIAIGVWLAIGPESFVDSIADFGPADHHFLRDIATFQAGIGIALLVAAGRPSWRVPVLFTALVMNGLHTINHLFDIGGTDPGWQGPVNFVSLLLLTGAIAYLMQEADRLSGPAARETRRSTRETIPA